MDQNMSNTVNDRIKYLLVSHLAQTRCHSKLKNLLTFDAKWAFVDYKRSPLISCPSLNTSEVFDSSVSVEPWLGVLPLRECQKR